MFLVLFCFHGGRSKGSRSRAVRWSHIAPYQAAIIDQCFLTVYQLPPLMISIVPCHHQSSHVGEKHPHVSPFQFIFFCTKMQSSM
jgi:hypothetical protein